MKMKSTKTLFYLRLLSQCQYCMMRIHENQYQHLIDTLQDAGRCLILIIVNVNVFRTFVFLTADTLYPYESFILQDMKQSMHFEQTENLGLRLTCEKCDQILEAQSQKINVCVGKKSSTRGSILELQIKILGSHFSLKSCLNFSKC